MREPTPFISPNPEKNSSARLGPGDGVAEPGPGVRPVAVGGGPGQAEGGGRPFDRQPGEGTQVDHPGGGRILDGKPGEGRIPGEQGVVHRPPVGRDAGEAYPGEGAAWPFGVP